MPYGVSEGRRKSRNALYVLCDNSLPDSWLASCVVNYNNLAISKLFQLVHDNRVFLVLLYVITSFHALSQPNEKGSVPFNNVLYLGRRAAAMNGVSVGIDEGGRVVSDAGAEADTINILAGT